MRSFHSHTAPAPCPSSGLPLKKTPELLSVCILLFLPTPQTVRIKKCGQRSGFRRKAPHSCRGAGAEVAVHPLGQPSCAPAVSPVPRLTSGAAALATGIEGTHPVRSSCFLQISNFLWALFSLWASSTSSERCVKAITELELKQGLNLSAVL